jgi:hypothetical protein
MPCGKCGQWIDGEWLYWQYQSSQQFLPGDVWYTTPCNNSLGYFFCAQCRLTKYRTEGWTPGVYINEDGNVSTDDDDEYFLNSLDGVES